MLDSFVNGFYIALSYWARNFSARFLRTELVSEIPLYLSLTGLDFVGLPKYEPSIDILTPSAISISFMFMDFL